MMQLTPATRHLQSSLRQQMQAGVIPVETRKEKVARVSRRAIRLTSIKERNAEIVRLCYKENKTHKEAGDIMGLSHRTVSNILIRWRKRQEGIAKRKPGPKKER